MLFLASASRPDPHVQAEGRVDFWTPRGLEQVLAGRWLIEPRDPAAPLRGLSTDSRAVNADQVFLALAGEKFDAHDFLPQAAGAGAALLIVSDEARVRAAARGEHPAVLLVPDTLAALQQLAAAYRDRLAAAGVRVIAVGGSNGKTTTRHLIHTLLSAQFDGAQSPRSFNNHIGVPLTLLAAELNHQFVVVEIGTNHPGEIDSLARIARPDAAVITSIGHEHMEFFKTLAGVAQEEAALLRHLPQGGYAVVCDDSHLAAQLPAVQDRVVLHHFGTAAGCELRVSDCRPGEGGTHFRLHQARSVDPQPAAMRDFFVALLGEHNALNAAAAAGIARWMGVDDQTIAAALAAAQPVDMRLNVRRLGPPDQPERQLVLINDAYNANPDSMAAAIRTLANYPPPLPGADGRRIAILGDMRELGDEGPELHRGVGRLLAEIAASDPARHIDLAVCIGKLSLFIAEALARVWPAERVRAIPLWDDNVPAAVAQLLKPGDVVLIKASRSVGLERLIPGILQRFDNQP